MKGFLEEFSLFGHGFCVGFGDDDFYIKEIDRKKANEIIIKNHYSKKIYNATYIHLSVYMNATLVGILQYGYAMNPASQNGVCENTNIDEYLELNRMWLDDIAPRNSESKAISYSIKYIRRKYPKIKWIQSFADERCGKNGIVYQAANFKYYGEHTSIFWQLGDEWYHNILMTCAPGTKRYSGQTKYLQEHKAEAIPVELRQFRYIYFIDKKSEKDCVLKQATAPKYYNEVNQ